MECKTGAGFFLANPTSLETTVVCSWIVDSQAALKALNSSTIKSKVDLNCRRSLENAGLSIKLCWVVGHSGNETADELARLRSE